MAPLVNSRLQFVHPLSALLHVCAYSCVGDHSDRSSFLTLPWHFLMIRLLSRSACFPRTGGLLDFTLCQLAGSASETGQSAVRIG